MAENDLMTDRLLLSRAVELAHQHVKAGRGGPFGAIIVSNGRIIAEGRNEVTSGNDPTAHAEIVAIRGACQSLGSFSLTGTSIYASCEPCPMCLAAIYWARIDRMVFASTREEAAAIGFDDAAIYQEIPKPLNQRSLPTLHLPLPEARDAFAAWVSSTSKIPY
ncbi:MAG: nucleoside deaminase [Pseudorhodoplanes sp.]